MKPFCFKKYLLVFCTMILLFALGLTLVFCLPGGRIQSHVEDAEPIFREEGTYPMYLFDTLACALDNFTDELMLNTAVPRNPENSALENAMFMNNYARYWHGYQLFLRPALFLFSYPQIRYISILLFFFLLASVLFALKSKAGALPAYVFLGSLCAVYLLTLPGSLQYTSVFFVLFAALLVLLNRYRADRPIDIGLFFLVVGMVTNFLDLLTAPLLTLGVPLAVYLYLTQRDHPEEGFGRQFKTLFFSSLFWFIGYGGSWACKWLLSSIVLKTNVFADAAHSILFRSLGSPEESFTFSEALHVNLNALLAGSGSKMLLILGLVLLLLVLLGVCFFKGKKQLENACVFLLLALYPYIWYGVLRNHSGVHFFFTFRIQIITVLSVFFFFLSIIDTEKLRRLFVRLPIVRRFADR